jgi:hypothetical protein
MAFSQHQVDPAHIEAMRSAFHKVCDALVLKGDAGDSMAEIIVNKIVALAKARLSVRGSGVRRVKFSVRIRNGSRSGPSAVGAAKRDGPCIQRGHGSRVMTVCDRFVVPRNGRAIASQDRAPHRYERMASGDATNDGNRRFEKSHAEPDSPALH